MADASAKSKIDTALQIGGLIAAVVAILITIFFSLRSERDKEITITYLSKRSLVSLDGPRPSVRLEVTAGGSVVTAPWLVSAKIENTGNVPIEERDIEAQAKLSFSNTKVIAVEITRKSQLDIYGAVRAIGSDVFIENKLLNPGDWIAFDMLFDGEPLLPAVLTVRISGVAKPIQLVASAESKKLAPALFPVPLPATYFSLTVGSLVAFFFFVAAIISFVQSRKFLNGMLSTPSSFENSIARATVGLRPQTPVMRTVHSAMGEPSIEMVLGATNVAALADVLAKEFYESLGLTREIAITKLEKELKNSLRDGLALQLYLSFPAGVDRAIQEEFNGINVENLSVDQIIELARTKFLQGMSKLTIIKKIDSSKVVGGALLLISAVCLTFILGGYWRWVAATP